MSLVRMEGSPRRNVHMVALKPCCDELREIWDTFAGDGMCTRDEMEKIMNPLFGASARESITGDTRAYIVVQITGKRFPELQTGDR